MSPTSNEKMPEPQKARNLVVDLITAIMVALVLGIGAYYLAQNAFNPSNQAPEKIVIFDASAIHQALLSGESELTAKEVLEAIQLRADEMARKGYIVIRSESVWSAPDEYYRKFE